MYPTRRTSCLSSLGWVGENRYASGYVSPAASLDDRFEQPFLVVGLSATYPIGEGAVLAARGWVGEKHNASVAELPAALLDRLFEHPE